jgi:hypothetical protein
METCRGSSLLLFVAMLLAIYPISSAQHSFFCSKNVKSKPQPSIAVFLNVLRMDDHFKNIQISINHSHFMMLQ